VRRQLVTQTCRFTFEVDHCVVVGAGGLGDVRVFGFGVGQFALSRCERLHERGRLFGCNRETSCGQRNSRLEQGGSGDSDRDRQFDRCIVCGANAGDVAGTERLGPAGTNLVEVVQQTLMCGLQSGDLCSERGDITSTGNTASSSPCIDRRCFAVSI
jgi:hypothetical protein